MGVPADPRRCGDLGGDPAGAVPAADRAGRCADALPAGYGGAIARAGRLHPGGAAVRRWLPHPLMAGFLLLVWLLLQRCLALGRAWAFGKLQPPRARLRGAWRLLPLALRVVHDIVRSNLAVAGVVLGP